MAGRRVQHLKPRHRRDPELARARQQRHHPAVGAVVIDAGFEATDTAGAQVEPCDVLRVRADPQRALALDRQRRDIAFGQTGRIARIVPVGRESLAVVAVQASLGANPDEALSILHQGGDRFLAQSAVAAQLGKVELARGRVGARRKNHPEQYRHGGEAGDGNGREEGNVRETTTHG